MLSELSHTNIIELHGVNADMGHGDTEFLLLDRLFSHGRRLTGCTGTMRYMAPEVAESQHYGLTADSYSVGF